MYRWFTSRGPESAVEGRQRTGVARGADSISRLGGYPRPMVSVTVDDREPAGLVGAVRNHPDVTDVTVARLSAGDIALGTTGFERKTLSDYVGSAMGRTGTDLLDQVGRLTAAYDHAYLLLEGDLDDVDDLETGVAPASIYGSIASVTARHAPVVPCSDRGRLVEMAVRIGRKHGESPSARPPPTGSVEGRSVPTAKRIYGCIDGVGPATADALHERFGSVAALTDASMADLTAVEGVGEERARAIRSALGGGE